MIDFCITQCLVFLSFIAELIYVFSEPPVIEPDSFTGPYVATDSDTSLELPCKASGKPEPFVAWSKDGLYIDRGKKTVII